MFWKSKELPRLDLSGESICYDPSQMYTVLGEYFRQWTIKDRREITEQRNAALEKVKELEEAIEDYILLVEENFTNKYIYSIHYDAETNMYRARIRKFHNSGSYNPTIKRPVWEHVATLSGWDDRESLEEEVQSRIEKLMEEDGDN